MARAKLEVQQFENYLELLVSVHRQDGLSWDWNASATAPPPAEPTRSSQAEDAATRERQAYEAGFLDKLFRKVEKKHADLDAAIVAGRKADDDAYQGALRKWHDDHETWQREQALGSRVVARDPNVYSEALAYAGAFDEVAAYGADVAVGQCSEEAVTIQIAIRDPEIVPTEIVKLTASGKLSTKAMPNGQYWALYQDHVCSCAIRAASEALAALPVRRVIVNSGGTEVSSTTGHPEAVTHLAVHFTREQLAAINLERIDPSDSMTNFSHRMKFAKTKGFKPVDAITLDDQFVTT